MDWRYKRAKREYINKNTGYRKSLKTRESLELINIY